MALSDYRHFLELADSQFETVQAEYASQFQCGKGCHSCCLPNLTVSSIERNNIKDFLLSNPALLIALETQTSSQNNCTFLDPEGLCQIYSVRPFVCRSHGAPIAVSEGEHFLVDVCQLNFKEQDIVELSPEHFFVLDEWNSCLRSYGGGEDERYPLTPKGILGK
jgi:uncharacterized protein